ncbi:MAG: TRAM domain-containing protein, partial [Nitrososphaerota archaeon]|nr:TRAM domain-containing protein [Nitrososphaerota archaeon]
RFESFNPKPVEVGNVYDVTLSDISRRGDGIAKIDGFVIFVAGGKQGQSAKVKVTQVSNRYAMGTVVEAPGASAPGISNEEEVAEIAEELEESDE